MALINGKQLADAPLGITTAKINDAQVTAVKVGTDVVVTAGTHAFAGDQSMGGNKLTNLGNGTSNNDAVNLGQLNAAIFGLRFKAPVIVLSTAAVVLAGEQVIDGVLTANSRVLLTGQASAIDDGIWVTAAGAWARPTDFANGSSAAGAYMIVLEGTLHADTSWVCTTDPPNDIVGTNNLTFVQGPSPTALTFTNGLALVAGNVNVVPGDASLVATPGSLVVAHGSPVSVGTANADGVAVTSPRSDHVHASPSEATGNSSMTGLATVADGDQATATTVAKANFGGGRLSLFVNGVGPYNLGNGTKVAVDAYISGDGGTTARTFAAVAAGDTIRWNGSVVLFQIAATDKLDLLYMAF